MGRGIEGEPHRALDSEPQPLGISRSCSLLLPLLHHACMVSLTPLDWSYGPQELGEGVGTELGHAGALSPKPLLKVAPATP